MLDLHGLHVRAALFRSVRDFFHSQGFLEVDTPIRQPVIIPEANIAPLMSEGEFLQTSPELCMKRLLASSGCTRIFQICPCFRKGERGRKHLEEFTMLEWYRTDADYTDLMDDCAALLRHISLSMNSYLPPEYGCSQTGLISGVELSGEWQKMTVGEAFSCYSPIPLSRALQDDQFDELLVEYIEPNLGKKRPTFLYDYPKELASLAQLKSDDAEVAARFELYISGLEMANGFTELTCAQEQRVRFERELFLIESVSGRSQTMPDKFLQELERLGSAAGIAFGLDRLAMLVLDERSITRAISISRDDF